MLGINHHRGPRGPSSFHRNALRPPSPLGRRHLRSQGICPIALAGPVSRDPPAPQPWRHALPPESRVRATLAARCLSWIRSEDLAPHPRGGRVTTGAAPPSTVRIPSSRGSIRLIRWSIESRYSFTSSEFISSRANDSFKSGRPAVDPRRAAIPHSCPLRRHPPPRARSLQILMVTRGPASSRPNATLSPPWQDPLRLACPRLKRSPSGPRESAESTESCHNCGPAKEADGVSTASRPLCSGWLNYVTSGCFDSAPQQENPYLTLGESIILWMPIP